MIDDGRTMEIYGYTSDELSHGSARPIVAVCEDCGSYKDIMNNNYINAKHPDLCQLCINKKRFENDPTIKDRMSIAQRKRYEDPAEREKTSIANKKRFEDPAEHKKLSVATKKRYEDDPTAGERQSIVLKKTHEDDPTIRERMSIAQRKRFEDDPTLIDRMSGENAPNWQGGISFGKYCPKFNNVIKQYIRDKYDNCDYISGLKDYICNPFRKLDVHHIDYNKEQGCDDHEWRLIPLSRTNHTRTNANRDFWNRLFTYSLQYDKTYYNDKHINIMEMT